MLAFHAPAKLNLFLHVTGKRSDGYHTLESLIAFTPHLSDQLTFHLAPTLSLVITGPCAGNVSADSKNLVLRAAEALLKKSGLKKGASITLEKHIPVGAGLGGGSADAATTLHALNRLWEMNFTMETLMKLALELGADVPACLMGKPAWIRGIGEKITPCRQFPALHALLVNPCIPLATSAVFGQGFSLFSESIKAPDNAFPDVDSLYHFLTGTHNDLAGTALRLMPAITHALTALETLDDCRLARMSGSGATCFGLFDDAATLTRAADTLREMLPEWWIAPTAVSATGR